jgi:uncharacterized protein (DUF111 family)
MGPVEAALVTPTGAALLATLVGDWSAPLPPMTLERIGTGAGTREFPDHPNVLRLLIGEATAAAAGPREVAVLETAIDDANPQFVAELIPRLLAAGALDAMLVPATMKKGRVGSWLVVVCEPTDSERLAGVILAQSTTLGVRVRLDRRIELPRSQATVETSFGPIEVKIATLPDGRRRCQPEYESVRRAAEAAQVPSAVVSEAAMTAWQASGDRANRP